MSTHSLLQQRYALENGLRARYLPSEQATLYRASATLPIGWIIVMLGMLVLISVLLYQKKTAKPTRSRNPRNRTVGHEGHYVTPACFNQPPQMAPMPYSYSVQPPAGAWYPPMPMPQPMDHVPAEYIPIVVPDPYSQRGSYVVTGVSQH